MCQIAHMWWDMALLKTNAINWLQNLPLFLRPALLPYIMSTLKATNVASRCNVLEALYSGNTKLHITVGNSLIMHNTIDCELELWKSYFFQ